MVTSSSSDYSSSSSKEDSKHFAVKARAKTNHAEGMKHNAPDRRVTYDDLMKRKDEDDELDDRRRRRARIQHRISVADERLQSRAEGVASDSDASEDEPVWVPLEREIKPDRRTGEIEKMVQADLEAEREEEDYWDNYELDIHPDFVNIPDSDSDEELEENSTKDDDDESDNSHKSDDSDESD
ncbi:glutamic acid-rich protein-like [Papaver somniferum]|uniref:glutamic acid-rich protein-like n=1 Tax=Papaver somniferum TaxID=3469 RepID=UPI000E6F63D0|nr:glutamic acid-rich protein-like [Papaver somniferum]